MFSDGSSTAKTEEELIWRACCKDEENSKYVFGEWLVLESTKLRQLGAQFLEHEWVTKSPINNVLKIIKDVKLIDNKPL